MSIPNLFGCGTGMRFLSPRPRQLNSNGRSLLISKSTRFSVWVAFLTSCGRIRTCHFGNPIWLPCAIVVGKSLLPMNMIMVSLSPEDPGLYRLTVVNVRTKKFALRTVKAPEHSRIQLASLAADVVDHPLPFFQIEGSQCKTGTS